MIYTRERLQEMLREHGLGHHADAFDRLMRPSIRLTLQDTLADMPLPVGASRFGGLPDLPLGTPWPVGSDDPTPRRALRFREMGGPLWFLLQIRLEDVAPFDREHLLPATGLLSFFAAIHRNGFPNDGVTRDCWHVHYFDGDAKTLQRIPLPPLPESLPAAMTHESPLPAYGILPECTLTFATSYTLPDNPEVALTEEERDIYRDAFWDVFHGGDDTYSHHLLGYAGPLQGVTGDMELGCEIAMPQVTFPYETMTREAWAAWNQFKKDRAERAKDWQLLLQLDSEPDRKLLWNAQGRGYFWITRSALARRDFRNVCLFNEST